MRARSSPGQKHVRTSLTLRNACVHTAHLDKNMRAHSLPVHKHACTTPHLRACSLARQKHARMRIHICAHNVTTVRAWSCLGGRICAHDPLEKFTAHMPLTPFLSFPSSIISEAEPSRPRHHISDVSVHLYPLQVTPDIDTCFADILDRS
jgi:hypothetical protein